MVVLTLLNGFILGILRWNSLKEEKQRPCNSKRIFLSFLKRRNPTVLTHPCLYLPVSPAAVSLFWLLPDLYSRKEFKVFTVQIQLLLLTGENGKKEPR